MNINEKINKILNDINDGNKDFEYSDYELDQQSFGEIIAYLLSENLIANATLKRAEKGNKIIFVLMSNVKITMKGQEYIEKMV